MSSIRPADSSDRPTVRPPESCPNPIPSTAAPTAATSTPSGRAAARRAAPGTRWPRSRSGARAARGGTRQAAAGGAGLVAPPARLRDVATHPLQRWRTGLPEFDFVLGGGLVPGSMILIGGEPGIGKSTLLLQAAARLEAGGRTVLYASGEESPDQIRLRAERLLDEDAGAVHVLGETRLEAILGAAAAVAADVVVIDSIQTVYTESLESAPGNVGPGARVLRPADALRQGERHRGGRGGPRHQGRRHRGSQDARAHRRHGALLRGRGHARLPAAPHHQEPLRLGGRAGRLLDDRAWPRRGPQSLGRLPRRAGGGHQRQRGHRAHGRHAAGAGRSPGARRQVRVRHAAAGGHGPRPQAARGAARGARAAGRARRSPISTSSCRSRPASA